MISKFNKSTQINAMWIDILSLMNFFLLKNNYLLPFNIYLFPQDVKLFDFHFESDNLFSIGLCKLLILN